MLNAPAIRRESACEDWWFGSGLRARADRAPGDGPGARAGRMNTRLLAASLAGIPLLNVLSCTSTTEPEPLQEADLVGNYAAVTLTATAGGETADLLAEGYGISLTLSAGGTTSGTLFIAEGGGLTLDLTGRWSFDPHPPEVRLDHDADTLLRDMRLAAGREGGVIQLRGEATFSGTEVHLVLAHT